MKIVQTPDPVLAQKAARIVKIDKETSSLIEDMKVTLAEQSDPEGVGLAAPQVGKSLQLFIIRENPDDPFFVFINPHVTLFGKPFQRKSKNGGNLVEGCLSIKAVWGTVQRYPKVKVTFMDEEGVTQTKIYTGSFAVIIQHEYDHIQGILFPRRTLEQKGRLYKTRKDKNGKEIWDPMEL